MPTFGRASMSRLITCDLKLQQICFELIKDYDITVVCGVRDEAAQTEAYLAGNSESQWPESNHNTILPVKSLAIDIAPWISGKGLMWDVRHIYFMAGRFMQIAFDLNIPVRWGGDWDGDHYSGDQTFHDGGHFELVV